MLAFRPNFKVDKKKRKILGVRTININVFSRGQWNCIRGAFTFFLLKSVGLGSHERMSEFFVRYFLP